VKTFMRLGGAYLSDSLEFDAKHLALAEFRRAAKQLHRYGQTLQASLHIAPDRDSLVEYPDYTVTLGPRGGVQVQRA